MTKKIFAPFSLNGLEVKNRIAMAPMTRSRSTEGDVITEMAAEYYAQRAEAGLIISEGSPVSKEARGYAMTPGIYTQAQVEGWKKVTQAVHDKGGKIFIQLWHCGRRAARVTTGGVQPLSASAVKIVDKVFGPLEAGGYGMIESDKPKAMTMEDIKRTQKDFVEAAKNAMEAGFDGVEIHGAHGYLFDQFMRTNVNQRTDEYGGSTENRIRFVKEMVEQLVDTIGAEKTAIRLSPFLVESGSVDAEMGETVLTLLREINQYKLAYVHLSEKIASAVDVPDAFRIAVREVFDHPIIVCGELDLEKAEQLLEAGHADMVAFGRPFINNPDLVDRFRQGYPLDKLEPTAFNSFYGGGAEGYIDYKPYQKL